MPTYGKLIDRRCAGNGDCGVLDRAMLEARPETAKPSRNSLPGEIAAAMVVAALLWAFSRVTQGLAPPTFDGPIYLALAEGERVRPPWCFHILTPWLAHWLSPAAPLRGFEIISMVSFIAASGAMAALIHRVLPETDRIVRLAGVGLFMSTCTGVFMFRNYFYTDPVAYTLLTCSALAVLARNDWALAGITAFAILNRETALFIGPMWLAANYRDGLLRVLIRGVLVFAPASAVYGVLHYTPLILGYQARHMSYWTPAGARELWDTNISFLGTESVALGLAICITLAYGPVWLLGALGFGLARRREAPAAGELLLLGWIFVPCLAVLVVVDWKRGFQPLFLALIPWSTLALQHIYTRLQAVRRPVLLVGFAIPAWIMASAWWWPSIARSSAIAAVLAAIVALICLPGLRGAVYDLRGRPA